jgi:uncharacterized protein (TIGR03382 family)
MKKFVRAASAAAVVALGAGAASGQFLLVCDSSNDVVRLHNAFDGSTINASFIDFTANGIAAGTIKDAIQVGSQVWVSDQTNDTIYRFSNAGVLVGQISGGLDNIRGMEVVGNTVYVSNAGTSNGAPGDAIVTIDATTGAITGSFNNPAALVDPFDVLRVGNELYVTDIEAEAVARFDLSGNFLGNLIDSDGVTGIDFPQQIAERANGNLLVAGFSIPAGVYEYLSDGTSLGVIFGAALGPRGVAELGNGGVLWTNGSGIFSGTDQLASGGSFQYVNATSIPVPGALAALVLGGVVGARRRR